MTEHINEVSGPDIPEADVMRESLTATEVLNGIWSGFQQREGARVIILPDPAVSVLIEGGWGERNQFGVFKELLLVPSQDRDKTLVLAQGTGHTSIYRSELLAFRASTSRTDSEIATEIKERIENLRELMSSVPELNNRWPHILCVTDENVLSWFVGMTRGKVIADEIKPFDYRVSHAEYSNTYLKSIWDPRPLIEKGPTFDPELVEKYITAIERNIVT